MPKRYDLIVFDWDGTLVDSTQAIVESVQSAALDAGLPVPSADAARGIIGLELGAAIDALFARLSEAELRYLVERYRYHYLARDHAVPLFDGVADAMAELESHGFMLAVATGKTRRGLERAFANTGIQRHFVASRCADECHSKPNPQMLHALMNQLGVDASRALMVGDTPYDLQMARNAGVDSLAVSYGAQPLEALLPHAPQAHFDKFTQLRQWLIIHA